MSKTDIIIYLIWDGRLSNGNTNRKRMKVGKKMNCSYFSYLHERKILSFKKITRLI